MLDAADILIHRHPVIDALVDHAAVSIGAAVAHVIPGGIDKGIHRIGSRRAGLPQAGNRFSGSVLFFIEWDCGSVRHQVFGQHHRQSFSGTGMVRNRRNDDGGSASQ